MVSPSRTWSSAPEQHEIMTHAFGGGPSTLHSTVSSFRICRFIIEHSMTLKPVLSALVVCLTAMAASAQPADRMATIDAEGWLSVVGRTSDFIIRGGKNISAPAVEDEVATHPAVSMVAVVPAPDPVFGERVAAFVELHEGASLTLDELREHLIARGISKEWYPEYLFITGALPRASGGKVAKGELKKDAAARVAES